MDISTITRALKLPEGASDRDVLDRIYDLLLAAGEDGAEDLSDRELIRRGEHERVTITREGAVVSLDFPLKSGTETITELTIKRPTAKHMERMEESKGSGLTRTLKLIAELSGRAPSEIGSLDSADAGLCSVALSFLQRPPPRTGARS